MAENAGKCIEKWCDENGISENELIAEYRGGKVYNAAEDGEGFAHFLYTWEELSDGQVFIGIEDHGGEDSLFVHWKWSDGRSGGIVGQYPDGVSYKDITDENKISFGGYFPNSDSDTQERQNG